MRCMYTGTLFPEFLVHNFIVRLLAASILGAIIGFERDLHGRAAGLRTNLLVSLGAAVFMILSEYIALTHVNAMSVVSIRPDPTRIAAQIVTGIGFLGAGAIIKSGFTIRGLTTAAGLWLSAGIGMSAGAGNYDLAVVATVIGLASLVLFNRVERIYSKDSYRTLDLVTDNEADISRIVGILESREVRILYFDKEKNYTNNTMHLRLNLRLRHRDSTDKLSHGIIQALEGSGVSFSVIKWHHQ